jgi:5-methylcytosine-specific restriction endonuclease McrA
MERLRQKRPRLALSFDDYQELRREVLGRDGWKCQICGTPRDLEIHHIQKRSDLGSDIADNLIALCFACHRRQHNHAL